MTPEPMERTATAERRPAVWPWLLVPLVALLLFFFLLNLKNGDSRASAETAAPEEPALATP